MRVIAFSLGKLLPAPEKEKLNLLLWEKKKTFCMCLQETGGTGEIQVRKIMFVWNQNIMRK